MKCRSDGRGRIDSGQAWRARAVAVAGALVLGLPPCVATAKEDQHPGHEVEGEFRKVRFRQADPTSLSGGMNRFSYAGQDPQRRIDPNGLKWLLDPQRRPPEQFGVRTIFCDGETPSIFDPFEERCPEITACVAVHERLHLHEALHQSPAICLGNVGRVVIVDDETMPRLAGEGRGIQAELSCLESGLQTCSEDCRTRVNSRMNYLRYVLRIQLPKGDYP